MAMFVHLAFETDIKSILRNGISVQKGRKGVYAMPVTKNFFLSHQWLRELKRRKNQSICGIYFRIKDEETVFVGYFNQEHREISAVEAIALITSSEEHQGFEVVVPRKIKSNEIHRVKRLPQVLGWRYFPSSHGKEPCGCDFCQRGEYGGRKLREEFNRTQDEPEKG